MTCQLLPRQRGPFVRSTPSHSCDRDIGRVDIPSQRKGALLQLRASLTSRSLHWQRSTVTRSGSPRITRTSPSTRTLSLRVATWILLSPELHLRQPSGQQLPPLHQLDYGNLLKSINYRGTRTPSTATSSSTSSPPPSDAAQELLPGASSQLTPPTPSTAQDGPEQRAWSAKLHHFHKAAGHPTNRNLVHLLQDARLPEWKIQMARDFQCASCDALRPGGSSSGSIPPASTHPLYRAWQAIGVDVAEWVILNSKLKLKFMLIMDLATRLRAVHVIKCFDVLKMQSKSSDHQRSGRAVASHGQRASSPTMASPWSLKTWAVSCPTSMYNLHLRLRRKVGHMAKLSPPSLPRLAVPHSQSLSIQGNAGCIPFSG